MERFEETLGALERLKEVLIIEMPALIQDCLEVSGRSLELGVLISQCDRNEVPPQSGSQQ